MPHFFVQSIIYGHLGWFQVFAVVHRAALNLHVVFVFGSIYVVDYVYRLAYIEPALHPRDESYLIMVDKLFDMLL